MIFGIHCTTYDDPVIETFFEVTEKFEHIIRPGGHPPVSVFPFLKYIPERWAPWKKTCNDIRATHQKFIYDLVDRCVKRIARDKRNGSYMEYLLDTEAQSGFDREATWYLQFHSPMKLVRMIDFLYIAILDYRFSKEPQTPLLSTCKHFSFVF